MASGRVGLAFERPQLPPHLAQEILQPQQARLGRFEATLGLLLAPPVLQDAGGFLDDQPGGPRAGR